MQGSKSTLVFRAGKIHIQLEEYVIPAYFDQ